MNQDHVKVLVSRRMEQATDCLEDGRFLLSAKRGARTVVNRAYYAAFYAVLALLQTTGRTPRKHKFEIRHSKFEIAGGRQPLAPTSGHCQQCSDLYRSCSVAVASAS